MFQMLSGVIEDLTSFLNILLNFFKREKNMTEKLDVKVKKCAMLLTTELINLIQPCQHKLLGSCISFIDRLIHFGLPLTCFHGLRLQEMMTCPFENLYELYSVDSTLHLGQYHSGILMLTNFRPVDLNYKYFRS